MINIGDERKVPPEYFKGVFKGMKSADPEGVDRDLATDVLVAEARAGCRILHSAAGTPPRAEGSQSRKRSQPSSARVRSFGTS